MSMEGKILKQTRIITTVHRNSTAHMMYAALDRNARKSWHTWYKAQLSCL